MLYFSFMLSDGREFCPGDYTTREAALKVVELMREADGGTDPYIYEVTIEHETYEIHEYAIHGTTTNEMRESFDFSDVIDALFRAGLVDGENCCDDLFCAICVCEGAARALFKICEDPTGWENDYEFFEGASCAVDIMEDLFYREYPEAVERYEAATDPYTVPEWESFDCDFMTAPIEACEEYGAYFEKKYFEQWEMLDLTRYDDEGRAL